MATKALKSVDYDHKIRRTKEELERANDQAKHWNTKVADLKKTITQLKSERINALLVENGLSYEDLKGLISETQPAKEPYQEE